MTFKLLGMLLGQIVGIFGERGKAAQSVIDARIAGMQRSWTDEFIAVYWFSPSIVGFFNPEYSLQLQHALFATPELVEIQKAITIAVFGLGKINGRK